jgi:hypothetical protein
MAWKSSFILTTKGMYSSITLLARNNIKITYSLHCIIVCSHSSPKTQLAFLKVLIG